MKKLYKDLGGECEYYIIKEGKNRFSSHGFEPCEEGWKHYQRDCELTDEDIENASDRYGTEDADFMAAMDDLQSWCYDYEVITGKEKEEIIKEIENGCK